MRGGNTERTVAAVGQGVGVCCGPNRSAVVQPGFPKGRIGVEAAGTAIRGDLWGFRPLHTWIRLADARPRTTSTSPTSPPWRPWSEARAEAERRPGPEDAPSAHTVGAAPRTQPVMSFTGRASAAPDRPAQSRKPSKPSPGSPGGRLEGVGPRAFGRRPRWQARSVLVSRFAARAPASPPATPANIARATPPPDRQPAAVGGHNAEPARRRQIFEDGAARSRRGRSRGGRSRRGPEPTETAPTAGRPWSEARAKAERPLSTIPPLVMASTFRAGSTSASDIGPTAEEVPLINGRAEHNGESGETRADIWSDPAPHRTRGPGRRGCRRR
jgi:hypothetical protein